MSGAAPTWRRLLRAGALLAAFGLAAPLAAGAARAQDFGRFSAPSDSRGGGAPGDFDFYVLALSWSPGWCDSGGGRRDSDQCAAALGFVVHGLWPQYERGYPSDCRTNVVPPRYLLEDAGRIFPDPRLARYEWRKHGACAGDPPAVYFANVRRARDAVTIPDAFKTPRETTFMTPQAILNAFQDANPRLRPGMAAVGCRRGALQEVRVCFSRDLRDFRPCPEVARRSCRGGEIRVPAP